MKVEEAFDAWMKTADTSYRCKYAYIQAMCGFYGFGWCEHPDHEEVHYGCEHCPQPCPHFEEDIGTSRIAFSILYHAYPSYYNKKYNIDRSDPDYVPGYNEAKEIEFERGAKAFEEFKRIFKGTLIASEYPELFKDDSHE